jgi:spermidine/putrescine transport system permease protein
MDKDVGRSKSSSVTPPAPPAPADSLPQIRRIWGKAGSGRDRSSTFWILYLPPLIWLGLFFLIPIILMAAFSFRSDTYGALFDGWKFGLNQYATVVLTGSYWRLLGVSSFMALMISVSAVVLSYPLSYFLAFYSGRRANLYLVLLLVPFWTSYLLRVMAWKIMLGSDGVLNSFLIYFGFIKAPLTALLYNRNTVVLTLVYVWIPFAALPILAALQRIEWSLFEAAADLGARPYQQFMRITLPLSLPGVFAAFFMVFIPTIGEYVTPLLVGGSNGFMYGNIIQDFFTKAANWPLGSALSMIMLAATMILVFIATRLIKIEELLQ